MSHESSGCVRHDRPDCDACFHEAVQSPHVESDCLFNGCAGCMPPLGEVNDVGALDRAVADRDAWIRSWNRLEAAISHHKKNKADMFVDEVDEALYAARDRILKERAA